MSGSEQADGGLAGDQAEALTPVAGAGGGCCGSPAGHTDLPEGAEASSATPCCGTSAEAEAEGLCCGTAAKAEAVASGASCC